VLSAELSEEFDLYPKHLIPTYEKLMFAYNPDSKIFVQFDSEHPLKLEKGDRKHFKLWHISPYLENGMVIFGELEKVVPMSKGRI